jgi:hypothetical protein
MEANLLMVGFFVSSIDLNFIMSMTTPSLDDDLTDVEKQGVERRQEFRDRGSAYAEMQAVSLSARVTRTLITRMFF